MSLRKKTILIAAVVIITFTLASFLISHYILKESFLYLEKFYVRNNVSRAENALNENLNQIYKIAADWAAWDDTYYFMENGDKKYIQSNMVDSTFIEQHLNTILLIDNEGRLVYGKYFDLKNKNAAPIPKDLLQHFSKESPLTAHPVINSSKTGIIQLQEGPMLIASQPVLTSNKEGPIRGSLVMGRYLNSEVIDELSRQTMLSISILPYNKQINFASRDDVIVKPQNENVVSGYSLLYDFYGNPYSILKIEMSRDIYRYGNNIILYFLLLIFLAVFAASLLSYLSLDKLVLSRLSKLNNSVRSIGENNYISERLPVSGSDEISELTCSINKMLDSIKQIHSRLLKRESQYRDLASKLQTAHQQLLDIIEFLPDATFVINKDKKIVAWNKAMEQVTGIPKEEVINTGNYSKALYGYDTALLVDYVMSKENILAECDKIQKHGDIYFAECFIPKGRNGKGCYLLQKAAPLYDNSGYKVGAIESIQDITERKLQEEHLKYLSMHDPLTGLYNRIYLEQEINRIENEGLYPVSVMLCDLDGLKAVNDNMGHDAGDKLIIEASKIIKKALRKIDIAARIGGDEFAVLLPKCDQLIVKQICRKIKEAAGLYNKNHKECCISISIGYATSSDPSKPINELLKEADKKMYKDKRNIEIK